MRKPVLGILTRLACGAALGGIALVAVACGGDDEPAPPPTPAGFVREEGREWTFARPRDWSAVQTTAAAAGKRLLGFQSENGPDGLPAQVGLGLNPDYPNELSQAVQLAKEQSEITYPGYKVLREREIELEGASAYRIDAEYRSFQDEPVPVRTVDLLVQTPDRVQMNFFVRAAASDFERLDLERIVRTFQVR
jgi:hypothetical protein